MSYSHVSSKTWCLNRKRRRKKKKRGVMEEQGMHILYVYELLDELHSVLKLLIKKNYYGF
jgi:hypothetical protein